MFYRRDDKRLMLNDSALLVSSGGRERNVLLKDLSARGAGIVADSPLGRKELIGITISVPFFFDKPIYRKAEVIWCRQLDRDLWEAGLDFGLGNKINFFKKSKIRNFI